MESQPRHVAIATPAHSGAICRKYFFSTLNFMDAARARGLPVTHLLRSGDSLITRVRNSLVAEFMSKPHLTHLLFIYADIGFSPDAIFRLLDADLDASAGVYPIKALDVPQRYPFNPLPGALSNDHAMVPVKEAPTGLMIMKRRVFEVMAVAYPGQRSLQGFLMDNVVSASLTSSPLSLTIPGQPPPLLFSSS